MDLHDRRDYSVSTHGSAKDARIAELEARIAELEGWVKMAYFEGHADASCGCPSAQQDWQNSEARAALAKERE